MNKRQLFRYYLYGAVCLIAGGLLFKLQWTQSPPLFGDDAGLVLVIAFAMITSGIVYSIMAIRNSIRS